MDCANTWATCCLISSRLIPTSTSCRSPPRLELARELDLNSQFEPLVSKELHIKVRDLKRIKENAQAMLGSVEEGRG